MTQLDKLIEMVLRGLDDGSITMTNHRRDLFDAIYSEYVQYA
jgi:hypothetical protein